MRSLLLALLAAHRAMFVPSPPVPLEELWPICVGTAEFEDVTYAFRPDFIECGEAEVVYDLEIYNASECDLDVERLVFEFDTDGPDADDLLLEAWLQTLDHGITPVISVVDEEVIFSGLTFTIAPHDTLELGLYVVTAPCRIGEDYSRVEFRAVVLPLEADLTRPVGDASRVSPIGGIPGNWVRIRSTWRTDH